MCGICGIVNKREGREFRSNLEAMNRQIIHRGPDEDGINLDSRAGLAMRRLSIIDLAGGQQPIFNETGNLSIVYNGEIYNHRELRNDLERQGHQLKRSEEPR